MKALRVIAALILIGGASLTGRALYLHAKAEMASVLIRRAWEESVHSGKAHPPWPWADTHPVARLQIPRLGYDEIVLEGATPRTLAFGPAHMLSGAGVGEAGNVLVAGHRTSWFRPLEGIARGDEIEVEWFDERGNLYRRRYAVQAIRVVEPQDVSLLAPTAEDALTLITCYPFGRRPSSPLRFVVRARAVGEAGVVSQAPPKQTRLGWAARP